jgi:thiol-disulfide isomerase/thioredoxin
MTRSVTLKKHIVAALAGLLCGVVSPASSLDFQPYGQGAFAQLRKAHAGRPTIVHFWSVSCPPCLAELPEWAKIARDKQGVDFVFVNTDQEGDRARAQSRLEKAGLTGGAHYGFADDFVERLYFEADKSWRGELPFTALVGADGALMTVIGSLDDAQIAKWLTTAAKK